MITRIHIKTNSTSSSWAEVQTNELSKLLGKIQEVFENENAGGFVITFNDLPSEGANITLIGKRAPGENLPQISTLDPKKCIFCHEIDQSDANDEIRNITSLSKQVLVIPNKHYNHWFETPTHLQLKLFLKAAKMRQENPSGVQKKMELHCGSTAGQTVAHTHFRTGIYESF